MQARGPGQQNVRWPGERAVGDAPDSVIAQPEAAIVGRPGRTQPAEAAPSLTHWRTRSPSACPAGSTASSLNSSVFRRAPNAGTPLSVLKVQRQVVPTPPGEAHCGSYGPK